MHDQLKILRVFKLIKLLSEKPFYTVKELAKMLEISVKPLYKYIDLLEELGYSIDHDDKNRYFLHDQVNEKKASFSYEEMNILEELINTIPNEHPLKQSLTVKINTQATSFCSFNRTTLELICHNIDRNMFRIDYITHVTNQRGGIISLPKLSRSRFFA